MSEAAQNFSRQEPRPGHSDDLISTIGVSFVKSSSGDIIARISSGPEIIGETAAARRPSSSRIVEATDVRGGEG